jgi:transaldolase/glucose-6-phosphate isomerase
MKTPLQALQSHGQSVWLDNHRRSLIASGELKRLIAKDGVCGLTSNTTAFEQIAIGSEDYRNLLAVPESPKLDAKERYERIVVREIQNAADALSSVYAKSKRRDGYVSLEVFPHLAHESQATLTEARRLRKTVARENLMLQVPGTPEGIAAAQQLISEGINVHVTMLFAEATYEQAAAAYLTGLDSLAQQGGDLSQVASVASFYLSRIDTVVDQWIGEQLEGAHGAHGHQGVLRSLLGKVAIASAKVAYQKQLAIFSGDRWQALSRRGAQPQRLLWADTGPNNPSYADSFYVEELIGSDTISAMTLATLTAFRQHGRAGPTLTEKVPEAMSIMDLVRQAGIPFAHLTDRLLADGLKRSEQSFSEMLKATTHGGSTCLHDPTDFLRMKLLKELYEGRKHA